MTIKLTHLQKLTLLRVAVHTHKGEWYRAEGSGERVTLASLYRQNLVVRRAHRGIEGDADAAYEYQSIPDATEAAIQMLTAWRNRKHE